MLRFNFCLAVYILSCLFNSACQSNQEESLPVEGSIVSSVYASGIVKAKNQYDVYSKINGIVKKIYVEENTVVDSASPLFEIGNESIQLNTNRAKLTASFHSIYSNREKIQELKNNILLAQSKFHIDSVNYRRQEYLFSHDIGTRNELEQRQLALTNSRTALESAIHTYSTVMKQLRLEEKIAESDYEIMKSNENDYTIRSEIQGKICAVNKQEGEIVNPTMPIAVIGDSNRFYVELEVDELDIAKIIDGQKVAVTLDSYPDTVFQAQVTKINPMMDPRSKTFTVEAEFINRPSILYPMLTVEASIIVSKKMNTLVIPRSYLINDSFVLVKNGQRRVVTGIKDYEKVEIISGLTSKEIIYKPKK